MKLDACCYSFASPAVDGSKQREQQQAAAGSGAKSASTAEAHIILTALLLTQPYTNKEQRTETPCKTHHALWSRDLFAAITAARGASNTRADTGQHCAAESLLARGWAKWGSTVTLPATHATELIVSSGQSNPSDACSGLILLHACPH